MTQADDSLLTPGGAPLLAGLAVLITLWTGHLSWLVLVNTEGPLPDHVPLAMVTAPLVACVVGALSFLWLRALAARSRWSAVGVSAVVVALLVVLAPTVTDTRESFVDEPNRRATCTGWVFSHYEPDTDDGSELEYCVGIERATS